jgi:hypothetical protein
MIEVTERRRAERHAKWIPVHLHVQASVLPGETVYVSATGLLMTAPGSIPVVVERNGRFYTGRLVRATPITGDRSAYAIQLTETLDPGGPSAA